MQLHTPDLPPDSAAQRKADRGRLLRALQASLAFVLLLTIVFSAQQAFDWRAFAVAPLTAAGLLGVLTAPLLHGSIEHLGGNAVSLLLLGTLAGTVYPRATLRALPLIWIGSGLGAWLLGDPGSRHLGASGLAHGLLFLMVALAALRRDRAAMATAMIAVFLYGGMLLTILPRELGVSWESHLGGALAGALSALLLRRSDPQTPRRKYSWELEEELPSDPDDERTQLEPPRPDAVPVLWQRPQDESQGRVLPFPPRSTDGRGDG